MGARLGPRSTLPQDDPPDGATEGARDSAMGELMDITLLQILEAINTFRDYLEQKIEMLVVDKGMLRNKHRLLYVELVITRALRMTYRAPHFGVDPRVMPTLPVLPHGEMPLIYSRKEIAVVTEQLRSLTWKDYVNDSHAEEAAGSVDLGGLAWPHPHQRQSG
ncbi:hypothetical protein NDU88_003714 [Pleurodeles waltl]|uniref:Uncharacterized protein n=1 Tax=Pleurodeles waltl TaxID=8319 RepID=A0AAV7TPX3_PLEWA|nr:hypothetical protein NDU88_003714 [Pleurodeles waltl]